MFKGNNSFFNKISSKYKKNTLDNNILLSNQEELIDIKRRSVFSMYTTPIIKGILGIIIFVAIIFGISYAYFNYYQEDSRQADITTGEAYVRVLENSVNITLNKLYPREKEEARLKDDNYVDFTVKSKNTSSTKALYYTIGIKNGTDIANKIRISSDYIKVDLEEKIGNEYTYVQEDVRLSNFDFYAIVPVNTTSEITREYRLRIWVSDNVIISDTEANATFTQSEFNNLYANFNIVVNSEDKVPVPEGRIYSCQGCKFLYTTTRMYTTWNMAGHDANYNEIPATPTEITSGLYNNYEDLIATSHKDYFLGVKLNDDNQVTNVYTCGIKSNVPFCIEGTNDDTSYATNKGVLQGPTLWNNTCTVTVHNEGTQDEYENISCGPNNGTTISAGGNTYGTVFGGLDNNNRCYVYVNGGFGCQQSN